MSEKFKIILSLIVALLLLPAALYAADIIGPKVRVIENNITVSTGIELDKQYLNDIKKGISKEIIFYIDLFRVWDSWPDEFVLGKTLTRTLRCDPVKKEYIATSLSGTTLTEKRFNDCNLLIKWGLSIPELRLTNINELEPAMYFVKVTVESRLRRLPPIISSLFFFVKQKDFSISKESKPFPIGGELEGHDVIRKK
jgi:hypothetical protein